LKKKIAIKLGMINSISYIIQNILFLIFNFISYNAFSENEISNRRSAHHQDNRSDMNGNLSLMVGSVDLTCSKSRSTSPEEENDINVND